MLKHFQPRQQGFTLVELFVGIAIVGILFSLALPSVSQWSTNSKVRNWAESIQSGLQITRVEALKRNTTMRFQLVDSLTNSCATSASGTNWVVSRDNISALCATPPDTATPPVAPVVIQSAFADAANVSAASALVVVASEPVICFNGLGQIDRTALLCSANLVVTFDVSPVDPYADHHDRTKVCAGPGGTGGLARCLRVCAGTGTIKMCDPSVTDPTDPRICAPAGSC